MRLKKILSRKKYSSEKLNCNKILFNIITMFDIEINKYGENVQV